MRAKKKIEKKIVTDEAARPVAVQIGYEDWLEIERMLEAREPENGGRSDDFEELADDLGKKWEGGDGLEYQIRIREEWDHRP
ncbi:MAG: hypothetical protein ACR2N0_03325 [Rubrobacteraceae bacterium]